MTGWTMTNPTMSKIVIAGAAAEGSGAAIGWAGLGAMSRPTILSVLADAGCPADWAPTEKTAIAHAGQAVRKLDAQGYVVRRAKRRETLTGVRTSWTARWTVSNAAAATAQVGDASGAVVLAIELNGESITCEGHAGLAAQVSSTYEALREGLIYQAGEVTLWFTGLLMAQCGATGLGLGYYIPPAGRELATRLAVSLSSRWGRRWICPLLPIATSDELRAGIARTFAEDVAAVAASLAKRIARASDDEAASPGTLLRNLEGIKDRLVSYRALCGDELIAPVVAQLNEVAERINAMTNDTEKRGALLELDAPVASAPAPQVDAKAAIAGAIADRRAELAAESAARNASVVESLKEQGIVTVVPPAPASEYEAAMYDRFAGIELD